MNQIPNIEETIELIMYKEDSLSVDDYKQWLRTFIETHHQQLQKAREEEYERGWADGAAGVITEHKFMSVDDAEKMLREKGYKHLADVLHHSELDQPINSIFKE